MSRAAKQRESRVLYEIVSTAGSSLDLEEVLAYADERGKYIAATGQAQP